MTFFQFLRVLVIILLIQYVVLYFLVGCKSTETLAQESEYQCPATVWKFYPTARPDTKDDWFHEQSARRGCVKYYGPGACLVSMTKVREKAYHAICRRKQPDA